MNKKKIIRNLKANWPPLTYSALNGILAFIFLYRFKQVYAAMSAATETPCVIKNGIKLIVCAMFIIWLLYTAQHPPIDYTEVK